MIKGHNVIPALKDQVRELQIDLGAEMDPSPVLFINPWYDYQVVGMGISVVETMSGGNTVAMTMGHGGYTDRRGTLQPPNREKFLNATNCVGPDGKPLGETELPEGTFVFFPIPPDPTGQGVNILPAGASLSLQVPAGGDGLVVFVVALRPKDKDRGDASKRPFAAADQAYASYYK